ncbi:MAG: acyl-CoA thioester hydrolase/BAAT C-terminal domain-containing protein [Huintestinicola sp.]
MLRTTIAENGFEGILFPADNRKDKVMIVVSGSNGGMGMTKDCAEFYSKNGIPALAAALFKTKQTQKNLDRIPMEYISSAIAWLKEQGYEHIGIDGTSKGSEIALLAASMFPDLSCVIARVPSHFVSEGLTVCGKSKRPSGTSCWSYEGREIPFAPYKIREFNVPKILLKEKQMYLLDINRDKTVTGETLIPIEKIKAPILLLSAVNDTVWPSYESSIYMEKHLKEKKFTYQFKHVVFENLSHAMLTEISFIYRLAFKTERQNKEKCAEERIQLKNELLDWVNNIWQ